MCVGGGGAGKVKLGFFFWGHFRIFVVSLQFEPADASSFVEHPVPRWPSCMHVLFGVHVNSPPIITLNIIRCETNIFSCHGDILIRYWNIFITVTSEQSLFTETASNTIEVYLF